MGTFDDMMLAGVPASFAPTANRAKVQTGAEYHELQSAMIEALTRAPSTIIPTPGWRDTAKQAPASEVLSDIFCSSGDTLQGMLIGLLPHLCQSRDPVIRLTACAIVTTAAAQYAAFHEADLRDQRADADEVSA